MSWQVRTEAAGAEERLGPLGPVVFLHVFSFLKLGLVDLRSFREFEAWVRLGPPPET